MQWLGAVRLEPKQARHHLELAGAYGSKAMKASPVRQATLAKKAKSSLEAALAVDPSGVEARIGLIQFHMMAPGIMGGNRDRG